MLTPGRPNRSCSSRSDRAGTPRTKRHETSCRSRHARRNRTTRWEEAKAGPSPRLDTEAYKGQEPPHAFRRGQRTRSVSYPRSSSWELEGASWGLDEHVAVRWPCCDAVNVDTRHARTCPGAGAQVNQHQPLLHLISRTLKRLGVPHHLHGGQESADGHRRDLLMDIVVERGGLTGALRTQSTGRSSPFWTSSHPCRPTSSGALARRQC